MIIQRIIKAVELPDEGTKEGTDFQSVVPVAVGAGEPRDIQPEDDADVGQADCGDQAVKAWAPRSRGARFASILIKNQPLGACPAEREGAFDEAIVAPGRLLMAPHLLAGGLADVPHREPVAMLPLHRAVLPGREGGGRHRRGPPSLAPRPDGGQPSGPAG
jgi:hypothetical protein